MLDITPPRRTLHPRTMWISLGCTFYGQSELCARAPSAGYHTRGHLCPTCHAPCWPVTPDAWLDYLIQDMSPTERQIVLWGATRCYPSHAALTAAWLSIR